ncbi:hypothetical protein KKG82_04660 [Patescibacteria group bacterium]|nr:hypothetical protein [Patescibacteria group bacterium]
MAKLSEEIVEEWLNRQGYFTIRGIKCGVDEIDILAVKPSKTGTIECRHFEVQCSTRPVGYISSVPKEIQKSTGRSANSAKGRTMEELAIGVDEWIEKKFTKKKKQDLFKQLYPADWSKELVINVVISKEEVELMKKRGIKIHNLKDIIFDISKNVGILQSASGDDLAELIIMGIRANNS